MFIKRKNSFLKFFSSLMLISAFLLSAQASAQQLPMQQSPSPAEYSDEELIVFVNVAQKVLPLQQESQMKMIGEIEEENLTVDKFNEIMNAHSTGGNIEATDEELAAFNNAIEGIQEVQAEYEVVITEVIVEEGMAPAKYQEIITSYQQDPELQMRINALLEEMQD